MTYLEILNGRQSLCEQIRSFKTETLWHLISDCCVKLSGHGVTIPVSKTIHGIQARGYLYDERSRDDGDFKFTAAQYVGVLNHQQPGLRVELSDIEFADLKRSAGILVGCLETVMLRDRIVDFSREEFRSLSTVNK